MRKESEIPSGIRLMLLLKGHLREIMNRECANQTSIHLYCTGPYWVAFERSAYQLCLTFPDSEITPLRLFAYPFPIVTYFEAGRDGLRGADRPRILLD